MLILSCTNYKLHVTPYLKTEIDYLLCFLKYNQQDGKDLFFIYFKLNKNTNKMY